MKPSPKAAKKLLKTQSEADMERTDCPHKCKAEIDGWCSHGFESAAATLGF
jgi:hypothetical protein